LGPSLTGVLPPGVDLDELGTIVERDKNRKLLKDLYEQFHHSEVERQQFEQATRANIESMMAQHQARMTQMEQATAAKIEGLRAQNETLQRQNHRDSQQNQQLQMDLKKDHAMSVEELKQMSSSSTPMEIMMRFERRSNEMAHEIHGLRTKLQDRGFLAPLRITQPDPIEVEERPPVGTIELAQDVFTARLLLRLGFLKANSEQEPGSARMLADKEDDEWSEVEIDSQANDNVCGIVIPEVEESGAWKVKCGWLVVCSGTASIQLLALTVMLLHGLKLDGDDCYKETPTLREWFLLHTSKGLAMLVAATLMGRQLMDIMNYLMVAEFMFHRRSWEVSFTALVRVIMSFVIIASNIAIFMRLTNPADVWLNMSGFAFIAGLGSDMLDVAKRGVFGHDIQRTVTALNYHLHFMSLYPEWFHNARSVALVACATTIIVFSFVTFKMGDNICSEA